MDVQEECNRPKFFTGLGVPLGQWEKLIGGMQLVGPSSPHTMWVPGAELRSLSWTADAFTLLSDLASREVFILKRAASAAFEPSLAVNYDYAREEFGAW